MITINMNKLYIIFFLLSGIFSTIIQLRIKTELRKNNYSTNFTNNKDLKNFLNLIKSENDSRKKKYYKSLLIYQFLGIVLTLIGLGLIAYLH